MCCFQCEPSKDSKGISAFLPPSAENGSIVRSKLNLEGLREGTKR